MVRLDRSHSTKDSKEHTKIRRDGYATLIANYALDNAKQSSQFDVESFLKPCGW